MHTLHVITNSKNQAEVIVKELFKRKLIVKALVPENIPFFEYKEDEVMETNSTLLIAIGLSIHYSDIAVLIKHLFPKEDLVIYAFPIINTNIIIGKMGIVDKEKVFY